MRIWVIRTLLAATVTAMAVSALAQSYPTKPVTVIVPFNPGGGTDRQARLVEAEFQKEFGQPLVFVYKPGADGAIGANDLAGAKPDGYTIGVYTFPLVVMNALTGRGQYGLEDFDYLATASTDQAVLVTKKGGKFNTLGEFLEAAKANPGRISLGTVETLGPTHIVALQLADTANLKLNIVTLQGGGKGAAALLGDQIEALVANRGAIAPSAANLNYLATARVSRDPIAPEVPTFRESGFDVVSAAARIWIAPSGLPKEVHARLVEGFRRIYSKPEVVERHAREGQVVDFAGGAELRETTLDYATAARGILEKHNLLKK